MCDLCHDAIGLTQDTNGDANSLKSLSSMFTHFFTDMYFFTNYNYPVNEMRN